MEIQTLELLRKQTTDHQYNFYEFLKEIQTQLNTNKQIYENFLDISIIVSIIEEFTKLYIDHNSAIQIINTILDFMSYCKNQSGCIRPLLHTSFTMNYQRQLSMRWQKIREPTYFFNKNQLKLMNYIARPLQKQENRINEKIKSFHSFKFNLNIDEARKIASDVKKMCNIDIRSFAYLSNYLYSSCIKLEKFGLSIQEIRKRYEQILKQLSKDNPPAPKIQAQDHILKSHQNFKNIDLIPDISVDLTKYESEEQKQFALETFIIHRASQSMKEFERFNVMLKDICEKNNGFRFKSGVKIKNRNQKKAMTRIKQKILSNMYKQVQLQEGLSISMKDTTLQNFIDIYSYTTQEYSQYQQKIKTVFSNINKPIPFKVSDLLRGKCVFSSVEKINECCNDIKREISKKQNEGIKLIEIDNRLQKQNSDLVMKILFGTTIAQFQLVKDLNTAQYQFSHKLYQLQRSKFFSSLTQLSILNQDISKDYFLEVKALILANNIKKAYNYEEKITYEDPLKSFKEFSHRLEVRINFLDTHPNEIDIKMMKNQIKRLNQIKKCRLQQTKQMLQNYQSSLNNGIYYYQMKEYAKAQKLLRLSAIQFEKIHQRLIQKAQKGFEMDQLRKKTLSKYLHILLYRGINLKQLGKYADAQRIFELQLSIENNIKQDNSVAKTLRNIGNLYKHQGNKGQALEYLQRALQIEHKINGQESIDSAITLRFIGAIYKNQGKNAQALKSYLKSLEIQEKLRGKGSIDTAITLSQIGNIYNNQEDNKTENYKTALVYFEKSLEIFEQIKGKGSIDTAITLSNIGNSYRKMNNYPKALQNYFKCLDIQYKVKGKESIDSTMTLSKIGVIYERMQQYDKALQHYKKSTKIRNKHQVKYQDYAITVLSMGNINYQLKQYNEAAQCFSQCLKIYEELKMDGRITGSAYQLARSLKAMHKNSELKEVVKKYNLNNDKI